MLLIEYKFDFFEIMLEIKTVKEKSSRLTGADVVEKVTAKIQPFTLAWFSLYPPSH